MARTWLAINVELVRGRGEDVWPRPGRIFAAACSHTFAQLARAVDVPFARWDLAHLHLFTLADGTTLSTITDWDGEAPDGTLNDATANLSQLGPEPAGARRSVRLCLRSWRRLGASLYRRRPAHRPTRPDRDSAIGSDAVLGLGRSA